MFSAFAPKSITESFPDGDRCMPAPCAIGERMFCWQLGGSEVTVALNLSER